MTTPPDLSHLSPDTSPDTYPTEVSASADTPIDPTPPADRFQPTGPKSSPDLRPFLDVSGSRSVTSWTR